jgi:hypothetical protein
MELTSERIGVQRDLGRIAACRPQRFIAFVLKPKWWLDGNSCRHRTRKGSKSRREARRAAGQGRSVFDTLPCGSAIAGKSPYRTGVVRILRRSMPRATSRPQFSVRTVVVTLPILAAAVSMLAILMCRDGCAVGMVAYLAVLIAVAVPIIYFPLWIGVIAGARLARALDVNDALAYALCIVSGLCGAAVGFALLLLAMSVAVQEAA